MKKFVLSTLMMVFGASVYASDEAVFVLQPFTGRGPAYTDPCPTTPDVPTPTSGLCVGDRECPIGYEPVAKYCWDRGFRRCGITCHSDGSDREGRGDRDGRDKGRGRGDHDGHGGGGHGGGGHGGGGHGGGGHDGGHGNGNGNGNGHGNGNGNGNGHGGHGGNGHGHENGHDNNGKGKGHDKD